MRRSTREKGKRGNNEDQRQFSSALGEECKKLSWMLRGIVLIVNHMARSHAFLHEVFAFIYFLIDD